MTITLYALAHRLLGKIQERPGGRHHPYVQWAHELAGLGEGQPDETAWCGSSLVPLCLLLGLPIPPAPARARAWLKAGIPITLAEATRGWDLVILRRGDHSPGPEILDAPGHVTIFDRFSPDGARVYGLGGNQGNTWSVAGFSGAKILGIRRLWVED